MPDPDEPLAWSDPLLPPPRPVGTSSGTFVEHPQRQPNQYTFEGEMVMLGQFASGASRAAGPLGLLARLFVGLMLLGVVITSLAGVAALFR
jgi:hypothetical protein